MTQTLEFWFNYFMIPDNEKKNFDSEKYCTKILIPKFCPHCNHEFTLLDIGEEDERSSLAFTCDHFDTFTKLWKNRITLNFPVKAIDPLNDGARCAGFCKAWVPMAAVNQENNTFICWSCRQPH